MTDAPDDETADTATSGREPASGEPKAAGRSTPPLTRGGLALLAVVCLAPATWGLLLIFDFSAGHPHARATCSALGGPGGEALAPGQVCVIHHVTSGGFNTTISYAQELRTARAGKPSDVVFGAIVLALTAAFAGLMISTYVRGRRQQPGDPLSLL
jgi:hypothetical protein